VEEEVKSSEEEEEVEEGCSTKNEWLIQLVPMIPDFSDVSRLPVRPNPPTSLVLDPNPDPFNKSIFLHTHVVVVGQVPRAR
jgi:hypothetical protein